MNSFLMKRVIIFDDLDFLKKNIDYLFRGAVVSPAKEIGVDYGPIRPTTLITTGPAGRQSRAKANGHIPAALELGGPGIMMQQQPQAHASALAVAPSPSAAAATAAHPQDPAGGDAPPKQVAQAMERLGRAGRLIADIRLGADRLLEALFVAGGAPPYSVHQHVDRMERVIVKEEAAMRLHFQDLRALGRYQPAASPPALTPPFSFPSRSGRLENTVTFY